MRTDTHILRFDPLNILHFLLQGFKVFFFIKKRQFEANLPRLCM